MTPAAYCVCVPARDEADRLPVLLDALAQQELAGTIPIALCINNSSDDSVGVVEACRARHRGRLAILTDVCTLPPGAAHVGTARGRAMDAGAALVGGDGVLVTTDADCRPPPGWLSANLAAMARGADIVGGRITIDDRDPIDPAVVAARARLDRYWARVRAIEDSIDPQPHDPPPRHGDHSGASLAIRVALYKAAGGVPALALGEDQALVAAAVAAGGRLVHPPGVWTRTSPRGIGRAPGGMATAMSDLSALLALGEAPRVPNFDHWHRRAAWRAAQRADPVRARLLATLEAALPAVPCDLALTDDA